MTQLALALTMGAVQKPVSLALRALAAVKRAGGTVLGAGAATPVLGPELVTNGMFDADSAWGKGEGWSISGGSAVRVPSTFGSVLSQSVALVAGKKYLVTYSASITAQSLYVSLAGGTNVDGASRTTSGTYSQELTAASGNNAVWLVTGSAASNLSVDSISVKEILGYTYGNPPVRNYFDSAGTDILDSVTQVDQPVGLVLDGVGTVGPELFNVTLNFSDAAWTKTAAVISTGANTFTTNGFGGCHAYVAAQGAKTYAVRVVGTTTVSTTFRNAAGASGAFTVPAGAFDTEANSQILLENGSLYIQLASAGTINITSIIIKEITGNHATQATVGSKPTLRRDANGRYYWQFDPTAPGDFLQTSITTGNEGWVCAGVTPANTTTAMSVANAGEGTSTIPGVWLFSSGAGAWQASTANGTTRIQATRAMAGAVPQVVSMGWDASSVFVGVNGAETSAARTGTCASGANVLRIGMYQGSSIPFNGGMSVTVICPTPPPPADRALIERWIASRQGQTL